MDCLRPNGRTLTAWVNRNMGVHMGRYLRNGEVPVTTITIPNLEIEGFTVTLADELGEDPVSDIQNILHWVKDTGWSQKRAAAPAPQPQAAQGAQGAARPAFRPTGNAPQGQQGGQQGYQPAGNSRGSYGGGSGGYNGGNRPQGQARGNGGGARGGGNYGPQSNWQCSLHGSQALGAGRNPGTTECKVYSDQGPQDWTKGNGYIPKDNGPERFYCAEAESNR